MSRASEEKKKMHEALLRLQQENKQWRSKVEEIEQLLRERASSTEGLTLRGRIKTILDERDNNLRRIYFFRQELSKLLKLLLDNKFDDAKKELNMFLFKNPK